jgi:mutator protein MutT
MNQPPTCPGPLRVTAAILRRDGLVLLARRPPGGRLAGYWEFPGGKIEPGETPEACLARELSEELGIEVAVGAFLAGHVHEEDGGAIELLAYEVEHLAGELQAHEHDAIAWVAPEELLSWHLAPADVPIARRVAGARDA